MQDPGPDSQVKLCTSWLRSGRKRYVNKASENCLAYEKVIPIDPNARPGIPSRNSKNHLLNIPREIRDEINKYLLTNPILGKGSSVTMIAKPRQPSWIKVVTSPKYDLHPAVLRVCKQMYQEGLHILYERNVFFMDCTNWMYRGGAPKRLWKHKSNRVTDKFPVTNTLNVTPLTRYSKHQNVSPTDENWIWEGDQWFLEQPPLSRLVGPQASYVRQWKVIVRGGVWTSYHKFDRSALAQFYHAVCQRSGLSLSFFICQDKISRTGHGPTEHLDFDEIFFPLKVLRNVDKVEFWEAYASSEKVVGGGEISEEVPGYFNKIYRVANDSATALTSGSLAEKYTSLMKGSSPLVDPIHLMCDYLLAYAQTFERVAEFRKDMDVGTEWNKVFFKGTTNQYKQPYYASENLLRQAREAAFLNRTDHFRSLREQLLLHLEKQYQKINECFFVRLYDFIKTDKLFRGILWSGSFYKVAYGCHGRTLNLKTHQRVKPSLQKSVTESLILLEDCAASFTRSTTTTDLPSKLRIVYRLYGATQLYQALPREQLMRRVQDAYVSLDYTSFLQYFKEAVDDMYAQHSEIREARKKLFQWDTGRAVREIDINDGGFEAIIWDELEPVEWTNFERTVAGLEHHSESEDRRVAISKRKRPY
ncbi:hypothetical protein SBOR_6448 [Sclerotinia borealis F-4128]|uniref:Uncharacterized protein n=1 Tax=Sclerotinia borealis (strain F-4128) TaxID=1432307 RepID=W9CEE5_SCLBF|nr:hypothetical protein SBOR_6448 [Sclerotinia borealis F-4128]